MKIWLIQIGEALPIQSGVRKLRTAYILDELVARGHSVVWWASSFDHFSKKWLYEKDIEIKIDDGVTYKLIKGCGYKRNISIRRVIDHRIIAKKFKRNVKCIEKPHFILVSMPSYDLSCQAVNFAKKNNIPVMVDVRDQWPDIFFDKIKYVPSKILRIIFHNEFKMIKRTMKGADSIVSMMDLLLNWALEYAGRKKTWKDEVFYLGYKRKKFISKDVKLIGLPKKDIIKNKFIVLFVGTFSEYQNPIGLVECARMLKNDKNIHFVIAGDGMLMPQIKERSLSLDNVTLTGWINQEQIEYLLSFSNIGVCSSGKKAFFFPNKFFAYMSHGLPVLSAFEGELAEIINKHELGFNYKYNDFEKLAQDIVYLYSNKDRYQEMSNNAIIIFKKLFNADDVYKKYVDHIDKIVENY